MAKAQVSVLIVLSSIASACNNVVDFDEEYFTERGAIKLVPVEANGGIDEWYYEFKEYGPMGCNSEAWYEVTSWTIENLPDDCGTAVRKHACALVTVYIGSEWEEYALVADEFEVDDAPRSGGFDYDSSPGVQMTGSWEFDATHSPCTTMQVFGVLGR